MCQGAVDEEQQGFASNDSYLNIIEKNDDTVYHHWSKSPILGNTPEDYFKVMHIPIC